MNWYYAQNNTQQGPVDDATLRGLIAQGVVTAYTLVWHEGMANWQQLLSVAPEMCANAPSAAPSRELGSWPENLRGPGVSFAALKERAKSGPKGNYWVYVVYLVLAQVISFGIRMGVNLIALAPMIIALVGSSGTDEETASTIGKIVGGGIGGLVSGILAGPISFGFCNLALQGADHQSLSLGDGFLGFRKFGRAFLWNLLVGIFVFLWSLLLIVPGIIKSFSYAMTPFILIDHPEMGVLDAITESRRIMDGHKWEFFCLNFSFIGWWLLGIFTCGLLFLWLIPYQSITVAAFYRSLPKD